MPVSDGVKRIEGELEKLADMRRKLLQGDDPQRGRALGMLMARELELLRELARARRRG